MKGIYIMTNIKIDKVEDTIKIVQPNDKSAIKDFKSNLEKIANGTLTIAKGTSALIVGIVKSQSVTQSLISRIKGDDNYAPKHINSISKMFCRDLLGVTDFNSFDKVKKQGLKKAMKIAVAIILQGSLGKDDQDKSFTSAGSVIVDSSKFSTSDKNSLVKAKIFSQDEININGMKIMTIKSLGTLADIVLGFTSNLVGSDVKIAFDKAFKIISDKYDNDFNELPADCRLLWTEWARKLSAIDKHLNSIQDVSKLYNKK